MLVVEGNNRNVVVVEGNNRNVMVVVVEEKEGKCGGGGICSHCSRSCVEKKLSLGSM